MKKIFLSLMVFCFFISPVFAIEGQIEQQSKKPIYIYSPKWEDFCPMKYFNAQFVKVPFFCWYSKRIEKNNNNYWAERKINFDKKIQNCNQYENAQNCYMDLTQSEYRENNRYNQEQQNAYDRQQDLIRNIQNASIINSLSEPQTVNVNHSGSVYHYGY